MSKSGGSRWSGSYMLYASTIFLSAFLIFVIQPMVGKHLLPWFGGSSSVWATSLLFFTGMLFFGYMYVYVLTHYAGKRQGLIHAAVIITLSLASLFALRTSLQWTVGDQGSPALNVLLALFTMIGAPYFLLSTTGPLLQYWWGLAHMATAEGRASDKEPYKLYALSNAGSLLALIGYVAVIEPNVALPDSETIWLLLFLSYAALALVVSVKALRMRLHYPSAAHDAEHISWKKALTYSALAGIPSFVLVAGTTSITQTIAPVPLLWIVPLMLYLLTLIIAFEGWGRSIYVPLLTLVAAYTVYSYFSAGSYYMTYAIGFNLAFIFMAGLLCHTWLYRLRPHIARLPLFYLYVSFGGMLGVFLSSLVAPMVFDEFVEFPLSVALVAALAGYAMSLELFPRVLDESKVRLVKLAFAVVCAGLFFNYLYSDTGASYIVSRNFYGSAKVQFESATVSLIHGTTLHGYQMRDRATEFEPHGYYVRTSGVGRAIAHEQETRGDEGVRIGVLGLGTGGLSSHCRNPSSTSGQVGDTFVFYEIDPRIQDIAKNYFSYLRHCKNVVIRLGDGRLVMENERRTGELGMYDLIAMDAFTDDTVPVHLITREALAMYAEHLRSPQSIIAIHTSNRYLDLPPMVLKTAASLGFTAKVVEDDGKSSPIGTSSQWVLLAMDPEVFKGKSFEGAEDFFVPNMARVPVWTDSYASLLSVYRWKK